MQTLYFRFMTPAAKTNKIFGDGFCQIVSINVELLQDFTSDNLA